MAFDWRAFLTRLSEEALRDPEIIEYGELPGEVIASGWLGYPGATDDEIAHAEARLGAPLPPSYRAFLMVSNGWRHVPPFSERLWSTEDVEWFAVRHQGWIENWQHEDVRLATDEEYSVYGEGQSSLYYRPAHLQTALEVGAYYDGAIYLLNPQVATAEGEWEGMFMAGWLPGVSRYRSFQEMMQAAIETYLNIKQDRALEEDGDEED